ncbi:MAG: ABC transporter ATP-binding protein [Synergistaceae bacterium]|jgi:NitT/TauT family transport system ATP-binding protein|nr:ABC transporter ATP-binding protein [Synergistaceae bacterium]
MENVLDLRKPFGGARDIEHASVLDAAVSEPLIHIKDMDMSYENSQAPSRVNVLEGVCLDIAEGEFHILLGPSGCGKTTLLNIIAGFVRNTGGVVNVHGRAITKPGRDRGLIFQNADSAIFPWLTVRENVEFGLRMNGVRKRDRMEKAGRYIDLVGLNGHEKKFPRELSGGMKQRAQIARLLANDSDILIMDEPFGALDAHTRRVMQNELVRTWRETKKTIVFVTHDITESIILGQKIHILSKAPKAHIYRTYTSVLPYPRTEANPKFVELLTAIQGHFDFGGNI